MAALMTGSGGRSSIPETTDDSNRKATGVLDPPHSAGGWTAVECPAAPPPAPMPRPPPSPRSGRPEDRRPRSRLAEPFDERDRRARYPNCEENRRRVAARYRRPRPGKRRSCTSRPPSSPRAQGFKPNRRDPGAIRGGGVRLRHGGPDGRAASPCLPATRTAVRHARGHA